MNKVLKICLSILGAILVLGGIGGFTEKSYLSASIILCVGVGLLFVVFKEQIFSFFINMQITKTSKGKIALSQKQKSWFRRHWILTIFLGFVCVGVIGQAINISKEISVQSSSVPNNIDKVLNISATLIILQDSEINRQWEIREIDNTTIESGGFVDGATRDIFSSDGLFDNGNQVKMALYRFDSIEHSRVYYEIEKQRLNAIRGVEDWSLESNCIGIDYGSVGLSYQAQGVCLRKNIVIKINSISSGHKYLSYGESFMSEIIKKITAL